MLRSMMIFIATACAVAPAAHADIAGLSLKIEPIIGYEIVQKFVPTNHTSSRLIYGARVTGGFLILSLESEYTHGTDSETFPAQSLSTTDTADKLKIGLRSGYRLGALLSLYARGGVQATQNRHDQTQSGVSTSSLDPIIYRPYAGADFNFDLGSKISATAGVVVVFNNINDMSKNEYQTVAGLSAHFP